MQITGKCKLQKIPTSGHKSDKISLIFNNSHCWQQCKKTGNLIYHWRNINWNILFMRQFGSLSNFEMLNLTIHFRYVVQRKT